MTTNQINMIEDVITETLGDNFDIVSTVEQSPEICLAYVECWDEDRDYMLMLTIDINTLEVISSQEPDFFVEA